MFSGKFVLAVAVMTIGIILIQWFFTGFLFHKYQALTPGTWRKETSRSYAFSMLLSLLFAFMFSVIFSLWKAKTSSMTVMDGIEFGALGWLTFSIPNEIETSIYVNYSRIFVAGRCLSTFIQYIAAGVMAAELL
jgi:hypothetical protein